MIKEAIVLKEFQKVGAKEMIWSNSKSQEDIQNE